MSPFTLLIVALTPLATGGNAPPPPPDAIPAAIHDKPLTVDSAWLLRPGDILSVKKQALTGDGQAALMLARHFGTQTIEAKTESAKWMLIAAENGHPAAQYSLWMDWRCSPEVDQRTRARYWLEVSARAGDADANKALIDVSKTDLGRGCSP